MLVSTMQSYAGQICCLFAELSQGQLTHPLEPAVQSCPDDSRIHGHTDAPQWAQNCGPKVTQISAELSLNYGSAWGELQPTPHFLHRQWRMLLVKQPRPNSSFPLILPDAALQNFNSIGAPTSNLLFLAIFFSFQISTSLRVCLPFLHPPVNKSYVLYFYTELLVVICGRVESIGNSLGHARRKNPSSFHGG